jgi:hypothetical protein
VKVVLAPERIVRLNLSLRQSSNGIRRSYADHLAISKPEPPQKRILVVEFISCRRHRVTRRPWPSRPDFPAHDKWLDLTSINDRLWVVENAASLLARRHIPGAAGLIHQSWLLNGPRTVV